jgi:transketolase
MNATYSLSFFEDNANQLRQQANAIRALSMHAVQKANSGHPGMPMGMAEIATVLWHMHLNYNPKCSNWLNRDRFILSNGHGSMLLYALLHLSGYDLSLEDIKKFRQLHSKTPGHPEYGITAGVETTTGPLGQGLANAVGMAAAESLLAQEFNDVENNLDIINHYTYVFLGDGCLMEGISHEACSLAGTLNLHKLIAIYDDNGISIDGKVQPWFSDNTPQRFQAYGWHVIDDVDGHDFFAIHQAIEKAKQSDKPTLICCKTNIGQGSPNLAGSDKVHGSPLGEAEIQATERAINWNHAAFDIPKNVYDTWQNHTRIDDAYTQWELKKQAYQAQYPEKYAELQRRLNKTLPNDFQAYYLAFAQACQNEKHNIASRKSSQNAIEHYAKVFPEFLGGSADLTSSNLTNWSTCIPVRANKNKANPNTICGNHINYGVREFAMSAIMNGVALYGAHIPFGGTFLTFSDYSRNALRMAALMRLRSIFVFTHDSIGLGEDGPTHQAIEHVSSLRLIPNMHVWRPADETETAIAWGYALSQIQQTSCLILSRQNLPCLQRSTDKIKQIELGAYIIDDEARPQDAIDLILIATGSEVNLAIQTKDMLLEKQAQLNIRVISMPCMNLYQQQNQTYKESILPKAYYNKTLAIEAGSTGLWYKYAQHVCGIDSFGESAPASILFEHFKLTPAHIMVYISHNILQNTL